MLKYKKSIIFIIFPASFLFALFGGGSLPYYIFFIILMTIIVSLVYTVIISKKIEITQKPAKNYYHVGDLLETRTVVYNESILTIPYIEIKNDIVKNIAGIKPKGSIVYILPFDSKTIIDKMNCKYRGYYSYNTIKINISDIFGIFSIAKDIKCNELITIYPKITKLNRFNIKSLQIYGTASTRKKANEDYSSITDIRKYYPGDSLKKIHWKVSAKRNMLHVKNYEMNGSAETDIFINFRGEDYYEPKRMDIEEKIVECAVAIINYMLERNISTYLFGSDKRYIYIKGRDLKTFKSFMDELITVKSNGDILFNQFLESRSKLLSKGSSIIIITPLINEKYLEKIIGIKEYGMDVIIIYVSDKDIDTYNLNIINKYKIRYFKVTINGDVKAVLEG